MENNELNLNQMEEVTGGKRHFEKEADKPGWIQHQVSATDTLIRIANKYGISDWHRKTNMIRTGEWLWIKK